jgi:exopolysaccharide production protein ExoQ
MRPNLGLARSADDWGAVGWNGPLRPAGWGPGPRAFAGSPKPTFAASERADWLACFASLTMLLVVQWAMALSVGGLSTIVVGLFVLPWFFIIATRPRAVVASLAANWLLLALPLFALLSVAWSGYQSTTMKSGAEYLLTTIIAIIAASCIKPRTLLSALLIASAIVVAISAAINITRGANVGLFGSKNYFGLSVAVLLPTGWAVAIDRFQPRIFRMVGVVSIASAPALLIQSASTGALICSTAAVLICCAILALCRLAPIARFSLMILFLSLGGLLAIVWAYAGDFSSLLNMAGKDTTLTGRTYLWGAAVASIVSHPVLGVGYQAYWQIGSWGAEELWQISYVTSKTGYHFHDTYLEIAVDLGLAGLSIFLMNIVVMIMRIGRNIVFSQISPEKMFAIYVVVLLLLRSPIEVDLFWQFQTPTIILCMAWIYLGAPQPGWGAAQTGGAARRLRERRFSGDLRG